MTDLVLRADGDSIKFEHHTFGVGFPCVWASSNSDGLGGPPVEDAGTLHFSIAAEYEELYEDGITVSTTLREIIEDIVDGRSGSDGSMDQESLPDLRRLADELRARADWLEAKIENASKLT